MFNLNNAGDWIRTLDLSTNCATTTAQCHESLNVIAEPCHLNEIGIVKINDAEEAEEYGLKDLPSVVLFQHKLPTMFTGNVEDADEVLVRNTFLG